MNQNRPPQPGPTPGTKSGSVTHGPSAVEEWMAGGSEMAQGRPTSELGADVSKGLAQAGQIDKDFAEPVPAKPGDDSNVSHGLTTKTTGGFPVASGGDGTGRQPKSVVGNVPARVRSEFDVTIYGGTEANIVRPVQGRGRRK